VSDCNDYLFCCLFFLTTIAVSFSCGQENQVKRLRLGTDDSVATPPRQPHCNPAAFISLDSLGSTGVPNVRYSHSAIWTGTKMIVWGGTGLTNTTEVPLKTGGVFDPATSTWSALPTDGAPTNAQDTRLFGLTQAMRCWYGVEQAPRERLSNRAGDTKPR